MLTSLAIRYSTAHFEKETDELKSLQKYLNEIAPTKLRARHVDLGGIETSIWLVFSYVSLKCIDALVEEIIKDHVQKIAEKLKKVFRCSNDKDAENVPVTLVLELEDLDIEINLPLDTKIEFIRELLITIKEQLKRPPLSTGPRIERIHVPLARDGESWREAFQWSGANYDYRYWGLNYFGYVTAAFDLQEGEVIDIPFGSLE